MAHKVGRHRDEKDEKATCRHKVDGSCPSVESPSGHFPRPLFAGRLSYIKALIVRQTISKSGRPDRTLALNDSQ
jgi:hypothetical protein